MVKFKPIYDKVLIEKVASATMTAGGLHIPEKAQEKPIQGVVHAVGPGRLNPDGSTTPMQIKVGDLVLFNRRAGLETEVEGRQYLVLTEFEVFGVFTEEA